MLGWFNALIAFFGDFVSLLFDLPFFSNVSMGMLLVCFMIFNVVLTILVHRVK